MALAILENHPLAAAATVVTLMIVAYLAHINRLLSGTPPEIQRLTPKRWAPDLLKERYARLEKSPIDMNSYRDQLPPKLERRYIVTGGSGLAGGYIVLQLLGRGQPPESIRIADFQKPHRQDMLTGPAADVDYVHTDVSSSKSVESAFMKPWPSDVAHLPLTVFHTAAVIVPSDRSKLVYGFVESVNIRGTENVLSAAKRAGADVFVSTSSGSISIRPVEFWVPPWDWTSWPKYYAQFLNESDFFKPIRRHEEFFGNYPASKAAGERLVCGANDSSFRTGAIRPCHGIYGHPTDNTVGGPLNMGVYPAWSYNIIQSFLHGMNCAVAHLQFEAILAKPGSHSMSQAGRPFAVTDPNPPIQYADLWFLIETLAVTPFRTIPLPPVIMLIIAYIIEAYIMLLVRYPFLRGILPAITGDIKHLRPPLFSVSTHIYANNDVAGRPVSEGGLGYKGIITTLDGMCQEVLEWNQEHVDLNENERKKYISSVVLAEEIQKLGAAALSGASWSRERRGFAKGRVQGLWI